MQVCRKFAWASFTMLELVVVGAAVAVVSVLLVPAVQKVRESSNRAQCANNLRQMGQALHNYAMDFGGKFPTGSRFRNSDDGDHGQDPNTGAQDQGSWHMVLMSYLGRSDYASLFAPYLAPDGTTPAHLSVYQIPWNQTFVTGRAQSLFGNPPDGATNSLFWEAIQPPSILTCPSVPDGYTPYHQMDMHPGICYAASMGPVGLIGGNQCGSNNPSTGGNYLTTAYALASLPGLPGASLGSTAVVGGFGTQSNTAAKIGGVFAIGGYGYTPSNGGTVANNWHTQIPNDVPDGTGNTIALGEILPATNTMWTQWRWISAYWGPAQTLVPMNTDTSLYVKYNPCTPTWGGYTGVGLNQYNNYPTVPYGMSAPVSVSQQKNTSYDYLYAGGFKSLHPGGANFCFADGSVKFLSETISMTVYQYLGCRNDNVQVHP
jgi:prepilin-type processing-associated H-X9-DG protein